MHWIVVDEAGQLWESVTAYLLSKQLSLPVKRKTLDYLVRNFGCILIGQSQTSIHVRVAPYETRCFETYQLAITKIYEAQRRIALSMYTNDWCDRIYSDPTKAAEDLIKVATCFDKPDRFHRRHRSIESLGRDHPHAYLIDMWRASGGSLDLTNQTETIARLSDARFLVVYTCQQTSALKFSHLGNGWSLYGDRSWVSKCLHQRVEDQPDVIYGRWVAESLRMAILANQPVAYDIDAIVKDPYEDRSRRFRYTRLTLPVDDVNGGKAVLSTPTLFPELDLQPRFDALQ